MNHIGPAVSVRSLRYFPSSLLLYYTYYFLFIMGACQSCCRKRLVKNSTTGAKRLQPLPPTKIPCLASQKEDLHQYSLYRSLILHNVSPVNSSAMLALQGGSTYSFGGPTCLNCKISAISDILRSPFLSPHSNPKSSIDNNNKTSPAPQVNQIRQEKTTLSGTMQSGAARSARWVLPNSEDPDDLD